MTIDNLVIIECVHPVCHITIEPEPWELFGGLNPPLLETNLRLEVVREKT